VASAVPRAAPRARCVMQLPFVSVAKNALVAVDFTTIFTSFAMYKLWVFFLFFSHNLHDENFEFCLTLQNMLNALMNLFIRQLN
jgi:hypothetical protein